MLASMSSEPPCLHGALVVIYVVHVATKQPKAFHDFTPAYEAGNVWKCAQGASYDSRVERGFLDFTGRCTRLGAAPFSQAYHCVWTAFESFSECDTANLVCTTDAEIVFKDC